MIEELNQDNFAEKVIDNPTPSVIDFWAPWCLPCKPVGTILEKLSTEYDGRINFYKVDVVENMTLASDLQIQSIPTIIFFRDENYIDSQVGSVKEEKIKDKIEALLGG